MKKKMFRNGVIFAVILALLGVGLWVLRATRPTEGDESETIPVYVGEKAAVERIRVENTLGVFTLKKGADGERWEMEEEPGVPVYQTKASNLAYTVSSVYAQSVVETNADNLVQYGLKSPSATVTVTLSGGESRIYYLGNDLPIGNEAYFMTEGDPTVYTVTTVSWGDVKLAKSAFYDMTLPEFPESNEIGSVSVEREDGRLSFEKSETEEGYSADWQMTSPILRAADNGAVESDILATLRSLRAVNVFASGEEPEDMKLGAIRVRAKVGEDEILYTFGKASEEGTYMKVSGSELYYLVSTSALEPLRDEPFRYMSKVLLSPHIDSVSAVTVTVEGEAHTLSVGEEFRLDDASVGEEKARGIFGAIIGLTANGMREKEAAAPDGQNEIVFSLKDGTEARLSFGETDGRQMAVYQNGESIFTVNKKDLVDLLAKMK